MKKPAKKLKKKNLVGSYTYAFRLKTNAHIRYQLKHKNKVVSYSDPYEVPMAEQDTALEESIKNCWEKLMNNKKYSVI